MSYDFPPFDRGFEWPDIGELPVCELPEGELDYDGDEYLGQDEKWPNHGDFIADKPDLTLSMVGPIEAYIDYLITSTQTWKSEHETISESEREETNLTSYASEIRSHYGEKLSAAGSAEASLQAGLLDDLGGAFKAALNLGANVEKSFTQTRVWKVEKSTEERLRDMVRNVNSKMVRVQ